MDYVRNRRKLTEIGGSKCLEKESVEGGGGGDSPNFDTYVHRLSSWSFMHIVIFLDISFGILLIPFVVCFFDLFGCCFGSSFVCMFVVYVCCV